MHKFSVGIIGCGDIGFQFDYKKDIKGALTHFKAFKNNERFEVKAVAELKKKTRDIIESEYKVHAYKNYEKMLNENTFDVIAIATNDESHFEILKKLVEYEPKLVFAEKPLALSYGYVKKIISLYEEARIHLQINYTRRFLEEFYDLERMIKNKKIGDIESATFYYSRGLIHNASHYLDLIQWYIGETEKNSLKASVKEGINKNDDTISFNLFYTNGLEARFIGLNPTKLSFAEVDFVGTKGRIKINFKNEIEKYRVVDNKMFKGYFIYEKYDCKPIKFEKALPNAVENIYKVLKGEENLKSPASNSLKIFELINRIKEKPLCQN